MKHSKTITATLAILLGLASLVSAQNVTHGDPAEIAGIETFFIIPNTSFDDAQSLRKALVKQGYEVTDDPSEADAWLAYTSSSQYAGESTWVPPENKYGIGPITRAKSADAGEGLVAIPMADGGLRVIYQLRSSDKNYRSDTSNFVRKLAKTAKKYGRTK